VVPEPESLTPPSLGPGGGGGGETGSTSPHGFVRAADGLI